MSELKEHLFCDCDEKFLENGSPLSNDIWSYYLKSKVDAAIAELMQKLEYAEMRADLAECAVTEYKIDYDKLKSEADKVIADLEESHKMEVGQLLIEIAKLNEGAQNLILDNYSKDNKLRYSNYKRCLTMAKLCGLMSAFHNGEWYTRWINRWYNRWLELAEKFKETK